MSAKAHQYFLKKNINFFEYAFDTAYPTPAIRSLPFKPGHCYDPTDYFAGRGAYVQTDSSVEVFDLSKKRIWRSPLTLTCMKSAGCRLQFRQVTETIRHELPGYFVLQSSKGLQLIDVFYSKTDFDPAKLTMEITTFQNSMILTTLKYGRRSLNDIDADLKWQGAEAGLFAADLNQVNRCVHKKSYKRTA